MVRVHLLALLIAFAAQLSTPPAQAQPSSPDGGDARFTFHRAEDGYLRLDGRTGQVSLCQRRASGWQCQMVPDERSALETEIARLQNDNAALKKELLARNLPLPHGLAPAPKGQSQLPPVQRPSLPDDEELNRIMTFMEKVWRRLVEMIVGVQRDLQKRI